MAFLRDTTQHQDVKMMSKDVDQAMAGTDDSDSDTGDEIDSFEIFDMLRHINDPEHPLTLEKLQVIKHELISVDKGSNTIHVKFTPTIPNCSMATLIGLMIRVKLHRCLPARFKVDVEIEQGKHEQEKEINK